MPEPGALPPTSLTLFDDDSHPYFLWWADVSVGTFRRLLGSADAETRAYWMGALLREANSRDVWLFVRPRDIRLLWPRLVRYLGRNRDMWAYLLDLPTTPWPPEESRSA